MNKEKYNHEESLLGLINRTESLYFDSFRSEQDFNSFHQDLLQLRQKEQPIIHLLILIISLLESEKIIQSEGNFLKFQNLLEAIILQNKFQSDSEELLIELFERILSLINLNKSRNTLNLDCFILKTRQQLPFSEQLKVMEAKILFSLINLVRGDNSIYSKFLLEQFMNLSKSNSENLAITIAYARAIVNTIVFNESANDTWNVILLIELRKLQENKINDREFVILLGEGYSNFIINTNDLEMSFGHLDLLGEHYRNNQLVNEVEIEYLKSIGGILFRFSEQLESSQLVFCLEEYIYLSQKNNTNLIVLEMTITLFCKILSLESQIMLLPNYLLNIIEIHFNKAEVDSAKNYLQIFNSIFTLNNKNETFGLAYILAESIAFRFYSKKQMRLDAQAAFSTIEAISGKFINNREIQIVVTDLKVN